MISKSELVSESTSKSASYTLLQSMPKVELHVHLEDTIQPATLLELALRHNRLEKLPGSDEASLRKWFQFTNFPHFIEIYTAISDLLRTPIVWVFDIARNFSFRSLGGGRYDPQPAELTLEYALAGRDHGVIGFGLGGNEVGAPPAYFAHAFEQARRAGLISVPHAGELAGPTSVWAAIHALGAERIGHGVRSIEDPLLLSYLHQHQIPLEINITSNICLHTYKQLAHHPFPHLDRMGILVTVNSDDPPLFNTDLTHEYTILVDEFGYSLADVARIARNAFVAAAIPEPRRCQLLSELDAWVAAKLPSSLTAPAHEALPQ